MIQKFGKKNGEKFLHAVAKVSFMALKKGSILKSTILNLQKFMFRRQKKIKEDTQRLALSLNNSFKTFSDF